MIIKASTFKGKKAKVFDASGSLIGSAYAYNTKTREVSMYLIGTSLSGSVKILLAKKRSLNYQRRALTVKVKIPGSYLMLSGKKY